ncbi:hypothetical protein VNO80_27607 [Phaseolus coccineus]|uniref:Phytosulfokine n=1 Tax=Phaseolus coccineus TaxID=3886 RepID=A0AAN9LKB2_PHACN
MKLNQHLGALLFFLFLVSSSRLHARPLTEQGRNRSKLNEVSGEAFVLELEGGESLKQLLGVEDCNGGDEECLQRRMALEAHLDYIYTQHHKP